MVGLALLAWSYPRDGIRLFNVLAEFPSMENVLGRDEAADEPFIEEELEEQVTLPELTPEELLDRQMEALQASRDSEFMAFCQKSPTRLHMPDDDVAYLDPVFEALDQAKERPLRIMHYGDSQLEGDRMTGVLREKIQALFGGNGSGLLPPVQRLGMATATVETWPELQHYMYFGSTEFHAEHKRYGPLAQVAEVDSLARLTVTAHGGSVYPHCRSFRKVSIAMMGEGEFTVEAGDDSLEMTCSHDSSFDGLRIFSTTLSRNVSKAVITARGQMEVYGIMIDGTRGAAVDNIAMRGVSGTLFTSIERRTLAPFFQQQNVRLLMLQYGGNSVPYLKSGKNISNYMQQLKAQISLFKRMIPDIHIIFIGPSDMATSVEDEMKTYPCLPQLVDSLRAMAQESGVAFWDMYRAMGGRGSMVRWVEADPQLAGEDYIHFTPRGSRRMSEMLWGSLELYYKYYRFRHHLDEEEEAAAADNPQPSETISPQTEPKDSTAG
jgi:lysophospholipase L1-like esterase